MANCIFVSNDDLERYSKELGISKLAVHATIMAMTEGKEVNSIPSPQEVKEYRQRNNIVAKVTDNSLSEMASIKQQAIANGTFMLAPNGKPTNLTESQWLQVRTKAFKDWFGDWERVARSSKYRRSQDIPNSITSATYQGVTVSDVKFDPDMAPDGGTRIIFLGNEYIGEIPVFEDDNSIHMGGTIGAATEIEEAYRGKGYGKKAHIALANIAKSEGKVLYSDSSNSDVEDALWKSLVEKGIAEVVSEKPKIGYWNHTTYRIINDALPQADDVNPGDRGVSKVVDENGEPLVTYHTSPHSEFSSFDTRDRRIEINPDGSYDRSMMAFVYDMSDEEIDEAIRNYENNNGTSIYTAKSKEVSSSYAKTESQMFDIREREIIDNADSWSEQDDLAKEGLYDEAFAFARVRDQWTGEVDKSKEGVLRNRFGLSKEEFDAQLKEIDTYLESKTEKFTEANKFELFEDYVNKKMKNLRHDYSNNYDSSSDAIVGSQYSLFVKIKNPLIVDAKGNNWDEIQYKGNIESTRTLEKIAKDNGYDGVIVKNVYDIGGEMISPESTDVFSVYNANSVKSATDNNGEFSREDNNIYRKTVSPSLESVYREEAIAFDVDPDSFNEDKASTFIENFAKYLLSSPREKSRLGKTKEDAITYSIFGEAADFQGLSEYNPSVARLQKTIEFIFGVKNVLFDFDSRAELEKAIDQYIKSGAWIKDLYGRVANVTNELSSAYKKLYKTRNELDVLRRYLRNNNLDSFSVEDRAVIASHLNEKSRRSEKQQLGYATTKLNKQLREQEDAIRKLSYARASIRSAAINRVVASRSIIGFHDLIKQRILAEYDSLKSKNPNKDGKFDDDIKKYNSIREKLIKAAPKRADQVQPYFTKTGNYKLSEIADMISKSHPEYKPLMTLIKKANFDIDVAIDSDEVYGEAAAYSPRNNTLHYHLSTTDIDTVVHELIHAATSYALVGVHDENGVALNEKVEEFMNYIRDYFMSTSERFKNDVFPSKLWGATLPAGVYGFTNPAEFLAETFSNPEFQKVLDTVPAMNEKKFNSLFEEIWDAIVNFFNNIFGKPLKKTALDQAREIGLYAMRMQSEHLSDIGKMLEQAPEKQQSITESSIQERFFNNEFGGNFEGGGSFFEDFNGLRGDDLSKEDQMTLLEAVDRIEEIYMGGVDIPMSVDDLNIIFNYMKKVNPEAYKAAREDFKRRHPDLWSPTQTVQQQNRQQTVKITESTGGYAQRTKENADWSDITLALAVDFNTAGERLTKKVAGNKYVGEKIVLTTESGTNLDYPVNYFPETARRLLTQIEKQGLPKNNVKLNIAGNGIYTFSNFGLTQEKLNDWVTAVIGELQRLGVAISEIRSGGQTGVDEAGIIAAQRLGIPSSVHAPKGFVFRTTDKKDIADRASFERRFNQTQQQNGIPASYEGKITPDANTVFVFGSNPEGRHGAGAAKVAREQFGAIYGQGEGLQGNAYALPTKDLRVKENNGLRSIFPKQIIEGIKKMYEVARQNPDKQFKVAYTNGLNETTLNGYTGREMIQMFKDAGPIPSNVVFSKNWTDHWNEVTSQQPQQQTTPQQPVEEKEEAPIITSQELTTQRNALNAAYADNPAIKRDRVQSIARKFSKLLNEKYEQERQRLLDAVKEAEDAGDDAKAASLYGEYATLTKQAFLRQYGVKNLFNDIRESYNPENITQDSELQEYLDTYGLEDSDINDDDRSNIEWNYQHKRDEFKKVQDNFWPLAEEATLEIKKLERIIIDITSPNNTGKEEIKSSDTLNEDNSNSEDETNNVMDKEESAPESWMNNFRSIPNITSLSQRTREALMNLYEYDTEGYPVFTDLNEMKYLDPEHAHAILLFGLANMVNSDDFEPALIKLGKKYSFVRQLLREGENGKYEGILAEDPQLKAAFYQDFRKDATSYWSSRYKRDADGHYEKDTTFPLNSRENTSWLLASWKYNTEGGIQIGGQESVFNSDGTVNRNNLLNKVGPKLQAILDGVNAINKESSTTEVKNQKISDFLDTINPAYKKSNWNLLMDVLHSIGIDQESDELRWALIDYKISEGQPVGITSILTSISQITGGLNKDEKYYTPNAETGKIPAVDILTEFRGAYTAIAQTIGYIGDGATEGSFYHMDKTRNSYTTPNYLGRVMKELSDANNDEKRCDNYIEENYGKFNWFKKDGVWLNSWLRQLAEDKELRKELKHKVVLDFNKKGFFETDSLGYALGLLREFNAPLVDKKKGYKLAWYYVPMLSDTDSAEFVQFTKEVDEGYQDKLLKQMRLTVVQEYNRIKLVRERNQRIKEGKADKIANFDTRGLQFCFYPELNTWKDENGGFLEQLDSLTKQRAEAKEKGDETKRLELNTSIHNLIDKAVREIVEQDVDDTYNRFRELGVFDKDGTGKNAKFKYLKGYTDIDAQMQGNRSYIQETLNNLDRERYKNFTRLAERYLANPYSLNYNDRQRLFAKASELNKESVPRVEKNEHREMISKYVWNSRFATSQIEQIFATDLAYYKDATDFQKRFKEIHAPSLRLYTKAEYNGERVGKDIERSIYLADEKILSNTFEQLKKALDERVDNGTLSKASRDYILKQYENINSSDAQAYRTLDSYRAMMVMSGQWNDALEQAYKNFQSDNWTIEDFSQIFQTKKPYLYTQTGIDAQVSSGEQIKMGMQHKNSEFLLLAMLPKLVEGTSMQDAFKLRAIDQFMHNPKGVANPDPNDVIDVVNFTSAVKVGNQGIIDLNYKEGPVKYAGTEYKDAYALKKELDKQIEKGTINKERYDEILSQYKYQNEKEVLDHLRKITDDGKSTVTIHSASYEDYGIQTQTPEHIIDHEQLFGTQIRRLIGADITPGTMLSVAGTRMTAEEWWKVYNGILVDNIAQAFDEVSDKFSTPEKIEKLLVETIKGNDRYPNDLVNAVRIVDGRFNIPLFDQSTAELVESLINSVIKDTVTKQKIKGGSCIQVSSFGLSDRLKVVYDTDEKGNTHVKYMECYMPAYAKEFYQAFMKKTEDGNYILDMNDFPEELRYAIGYRVPTEDKYSMAPLKIVGFLPQQNGSAIMLPAEITTLSGSDFDVDKMYIMLPEFDVIRYDKSKAIQDFKKFNQKYAQAQSWIDSIFDIIVNESDKDIEDEEGNEITEAHADFKTWWKENKENYKLDRPKFRKIKGTFKSDANGKNVSFDDGLSNKENPSRADKERARKKRNNAIIDMMFSVLTNPDTLQRFVKPGGFEEVKKQAHIQRILENLTYDELCEALGVKDNVAEKLNSLNEDELAELAGKYGKVLDPLSPLTQIHFHKQNSAGAKAIGIYAVNNAGQALLQHSEFSLMYNDNPKALGSISLFGKNLSDLNRVQNTEGEYITNNMAQYLAASVDNGKDPTLEDNGQNDFTFNVSNMLIRLGFRHREVAAIMNQPIIKELAAAVTKGLSDGVSKEITLNEILTKYAKAAGLNEGDVDGFIDIKDFTLEDMYKDRCNGVKKNADYYKRQFAIGLWFKNAENDAMFVNTVTQNLRADAQNAAAGPLMMDTILREIKIETTVKADRGLYDAAETMSIESMKESPLGFMAAFQQFGIKRTQDILAAYFPQYSGPFKGMLTDLMKRTKYNNVSVETAQKLFDATILYNLSSIPLFSSLKGKAKSSEDVYKYFLKDFPETFKKAKESNPVVYKSGDTEVRFNDIPIIKGLKVVPASKTNVVATIVLDSVGRLSKDGKAKLTQSWEALMYSDNDNARNLALNLFAYSIVRYSGKYTPTGFAHLVPTSVREGAKGYIDKLEDIRKHGVSTKDRGGNNSFRTLFLRNNTENRTLFPKLSDKEAKEIMKMFNDSKDLSGNGGRIITANTTDLNNVIPSVVTVMMMHDPNSNPYPVSVFKNGIMIQTKGEDGKTQKRFFIFNQISTTEAEMIPVTPLGAKGNISEYFLDNPYGESAVQVSQEYEEENTEIETAEEDPQSVSAEIRYLNGSKKDDEGNDICVNISISK